MPPQELNTLLQGGDAILRFGDFHRALRIPSPDQPVKKLPLRNRTATRRPSTASME